MHTFVLLYYCMYCTVHHIKKGIRGFLHADGIHGVTRCFFLARHHIVVELLPLKARVPYVIYREAFHSRGGLITCTDAREWHACKRSPQQSDPPSPGIDMEQQPNNANKQRSCSTNAPMGIVVQWGTHTHPHTPCSLNRPPSIVLSF